MLSYKERIHNYIVRNKDEIVNILKELVKIPSVRGEASPDAPFGKACAEVLEYTQMLYQENGFETELDKEGGYLLSYYGNEAKSLGLFAHADVVPVGDDWTCTKPFVPIEKDGFLIGRGVMDDKSAVVISLYCAKMLKELDIPFHSRLVCFTGANEESGMVDIESYVKKHKAPEFSLVCDTAFPLYRGNKGIMRFFATADKSFEQITDFNGGESFNIILGKATARLKYSDILLESLKKGKTERINISVENGEIIIAAEGISKHGALPDGSLNAGYILAELLSSCEGLNENDRKQMKFVRDLLSNYYGAPFGIDCEDDQFGKLTCTNGMIKVNDGKISLSFDVRFGKCADISVMQEKIVNTLKNKNWKAEFVRAVNAHIVDEKNPYIQACLNMYKAYTGDTEAKPYINAGGTYAMHLPCAAEIGTTLRGGTPNGLTQGHGGAHQPDECISIDGMLEALELTMLMLLECDKEDMKATIFDIERNSYVDGPGIRTTVFFKGCNLRCKWCHNPESQNPKKEILFYQNKCTGCGRCENLTVEDEKFFCFNDAKEICGKEYSADEVLKEVIKDKAFYETSGGGVTFSGGECMLQIDFLTEILKKCKENGIHTAVDTAGHIPWESFEKILPFTDLFLYDIKAMNEEIHKEYTGVTNTCILENLKKLLKSNVDVWVRIPIIPDVNDAEEEMKNIKAFFESYGYPAKIELLPYHAMGEHKYEALGKSVEKFDVPDKEKIEKLKNIVVPY